MVVLIVIFVMHYIKMHSVKVYGVLIIIIIIVMILVVMVLVLVLVVEHVSGISLVSLFFFFSLFFLFCLLIYKISDSFSSYFWLFFCCLHLKHVTLCFFSLQFFRNYFISFHFLFDSFFSCAASFLPFLSFI